ncbi:probable E3 ubiquitin-protein ligase RHY1A isoform X1 [Lycium ferocissimum]|uniref:probable E3 ubiquitin-protein ligase RHY1A isoform X1 n=1 Tax=Lycium ferocissimum TaxID=112874 RepID=UPI002814D495|nr:probable E3 ubiquitin-protein ligase RHY1A isoform X1 [Lycium ferocissimum]
MSSMFTALLSARRRRFHQSSGLFLDTPSSTSATKQRSAPDQASYRDDEELGEIASEARQRLDKKLIAQRFNINRQKRPKKECNLLKSGSKKLNWAKLKPKAKQRNCVICLEPFDGGGNLMQLPCAHKFHSKCLVPWLESNAHCPCCRMIVQITQ